jgi:hypothetical protein
VAQPNSRSGVLQTKNMNPSQQQDTTTMNMNSTRQLTNKNCGSKCYRIAESVYVFLAFSVELGTKTNTNYKTHKNTSRATGNLISLVELLVLDLPRGRGRSIGGDLSVGEEGSEQMIVTLQSLHHSSVGYQHVRTRVDLTKKAYPCKCN